MKRKNMSNNTTLYAIGLGMLTASGVSLILMFLNTMLIYNEYCGMDMLQKVQPIIQVVSVFAGCYISEKIGKENKIVIGCMVAGGYDALLLTISGLFLDGISGEFWVCLITSVVACTASILVNDKEKRKTSRKKSFR